MRACVVCGAPSSEGARFCSSRGAAIPRGEEEAGRVRKVVTVVFSDLAGSTGLGERLDPESLTLVMGRYFERSRAVLERHGGTVQKFIGDAVLAVFGIPVVREDDALRAVRAAAELPTALAELNTELVRDYGVSLELRTGVNTGEVLAGDPAAAQALALGDTVNVAARLEQAGLPMEGIASAVRAGRLSFAFLEAAPFRRWAVRSTRTYRQVSQETGVPLELLGGALESMGFARMGPMSRCGRTSWR
jgi:class 3 adenylate cyclase